MKWLGEYLYIIIVNPCGKTVLTRIMQNIQVWIFYGGNKQNTIEAGYREFYYTHWN